MSIPKVARSQSITRLVVLDSEPTGLNPETDRIMELGLIEAHIRPSQPTEIVSRQRLFINPEREVPKAATLITGISTDDVRDAPTFADRATALHSLLEGAVWVAHNISFDLAYLSAEFQRAKLSLPESAGRIDTQRLFKDQVQGYTSTTLTECCRHLGISPSPHTGTLGDVHDTLSLLLELNRRSGGPLRWEGGDA